MYFYIPMALICISLMPDNVACHVMCLFVICMFSLVKFVYIFVHILTEGFFFNFWEWFIYFEYKSFIKYFKVFPNLWLVCSFPRHCLLKTHFRFYLLFGENAREHEQVEGEKEKEERKSQADSGLSAKPYSGHLTTQRPWPVWKSSVRS